ncbi:hypothetical protein D3C76_1312800 [compost metagenome]
MDGIDHHPGIGQVERRGAQQAEDKSPAIATQGQPPVLGIKPGKGVAVTLQQQRRETEQLDLLDVALMGKQRLDVILLPALRRTPGKQAKGIPGKVRLGKKHG